MTIELNFTAILAAIVTLGLSIITYFVKRQLDEVKAISERIGEVVKEQTKHGVWIEDLRKDYARLELKYEDLVGFLRDSGFRKRDGS